MIRRPPRSTQSRSSAASDVYKRQAHQDAAALAELGGGRHLRVVAHPLEQIHVVPGEDPALQGRERHALAGPVVEGAQADVVARVEIAVVDREIGEIQQLSLIHISEPTRLGMISYAVFCLK